MYGVVDINTNVVTLVIYSISNNKIKPIVTKRHAINLTTYIDANNNLKDSGVKTIMRILLDFKEILNSMHINEVLPFATYAIKNLNNREYVIDYLNEKTGFNIKVLNDEDKIIYDYYGAMQSVKITDGLLVDISANSTRLIFHENCKIIKSVILPFGSLTFLNNYVENIIPSNDEIKAMESEIQLQLKNKNVYKNDNLSSKIYTVGSVARSVLKLIKNINTANNYENNEYGIEDLHNLKNLSIKNDDVLSRQILNIEPNSFNTFIPGLIILNEIITYFSGEKISVCFTGVREGYVQKILEELMIIQ